MPGDFSIASFVYGSLSKRQARPRGKPTATTSSIKRDGLPPQPLTQDQSAALRLSENDPFKRMERYLSRVDGSGLADETSMGPMHDADGLSPCEAGSYERMQHYLHRAVELALTDDAKVDMMNRNVANGAFTAAHYVRMWSRRVQCAEEAAAVQALLRSAAWTDADETGRALRGVLVEAVSLELADRHAVKAMVAHIASGAFTEAYYLAMWSRRVREAKEAAVVLRAGQSAAAREVRHEARQRTRQLEARASPLSYDTVSESSSDDGQ
jgi:hypothetical protein